MRAVDLAQLVLELLDGGRGREDLRRQARRAAAL